MTPKSSIGNIERYLILCRAFPIRNNSIICGFSFSFFVHDWTEAKHDCKPVSAAAESAVQMTYTACSRQQRDGDG